MGVSSPAGGNPLVAYALRHPLQAYRYLRAPASFSALLPRRCSPRQFRAWLREAAGITQEIQARLESESWTSGGRGGPASAADRGPVLYAAVRALRPEVVVETGVASGSSSYYFLSALEANGRGTLYSIELPPPLLARADPVYARRDKVSLPAGRESGWLVPDRLRSRWELLLGDARDLLPQLAARVPALNFFFHDSEHSYDVMRFEYDVAWKKLAPGGVLGSDDVSWNTAFRDFVRERGTRSLYVGGYGFTASPS